MEGGPTESMVPEPVLDSAKTTLRNVEALRTQFLEFLSLADPDVLAEMPPLQRARALLVLAKAASTLLAVRLRCNGVDPDDHPIKSELERLSLYEGKLERLVDLSKAPLRPSTTLNLQATTRFIEHSLPDLTPDQRQSMRELSRGGGPKLKKSYERKRKYQSSGLHSVQATAKEFLEKAAQELLGSNRTGFKGPLIDNSDEENGHDKVIKGLVEISSDED